LKRIVTITIYTILGFLFLGVAGSLAAADINNIRATIYSWQEAWQSKDINQYKLFYSKKFKSDGYDYQRWMNKKEKIFTMPGAISVELFDLEISTQDGRIIATFIQRYKSAGLSDDGEKKLVLIQSGDMYKIIAETFVLLENPTPSDEESLFGVQPHRTQPERVKQQTPKAPLSHTPMVKRPISKSAIRLAKLTHAPSLLQTMQTISEKDKPQSADTPKDEWQRVIYANSVKGWINTHLIARDAIFSHKKSGQFGPQAPEPIVEEKNLTEISQPASDTGEHVISKTSLEWLYLKPSTDSKKTERLTEGKIYLAVKKEGNWMGLQLDQGGVGWTDQKHLSLVKPPIPETTPGPASNISELPVPETTPAPAKKTFEPPVPETTPTPANKPSETAVLSPPLVNEDGIATRTIKLVTPKVSFARAYDKPTIDSMILFRLKQDKRYILLETQGDWHHIKDDNGMTGWGHRTLFMKKIETADAPVAIHREETRQLVPETRDLSYEHTPERDSALTPDALAPDLLGEPALPSERVSTKTLSESAGAPGLFAEGQDEKPEIIESPQDKRPLFPEDEAPPVAPADEPIIDLENKPKEVKQGEAEPSSDENRSQLTIKSGNQLTPTVSLVRVYSKPSTDARIMFWLTKGKTYTYTDKKEGWYHIQLADGRTGWTHLVLYMNGPGARKKMKTKREAVSINKELTSVVILGGAHEKPFLDSKVIFRLEKGEAYTAEKMQGSWYLIKNDNGDTGWAHKSLFAPDNPKPIENDDENIKRVNDIRFETTQNGEEKILFSLSGFYPPTVFLTEESQSTLICDFSNIRTLNGLKRLIDINQHFVKQIRTEMHKNALRVSIDLTPGKNYDVRQVFFKKENLFTLIFSANEN